jgi:hypothetical protein
MEIAGKWVEMPDGVVRPLIRVTITAASGESEADVFLIDTGADRTVLSYAFLDRLQLPVDGGPADFGLQGVGGASPFVPVEAVLEFTTTDERPVKVRGRFAAFVDPAATDTSILGRDVLNNFDLIVSHRRAEIRLLAPNHRYRVERE